jgi:hypothetical protein
MLFLGRAILQAAHQGRGQADRGQRGEVAGASWEWLVALILNWLRRQVDRIFNLTSAGFAKPHVPNTMIRHMRGPFRRDHISTTERTFTE